MGVLVGLARKAVVLAVGLPLLVIGLILIPLPGPGILTVLAALFILSIEFDSLKPYRDRAKKEITKLIEKSKAASKQADRK